MKTINPQIQKCSEVNQDKHKEKNTKAVHIQNGKIQ